MFRIYTAPDGKPATYSEDNIPLKSKYFFNISIKGVEQNDFTMILGFPGSTDRYLTSWGVEQTLEQDNPILIKVRTKKLNIMKEDMEANKEIYIKYASKYSISSNYWKYSIGQNKGLKKLKVHEKKRNTETELQNWISNETKRKETYSKQIEAILEKWKADNKKNYQQELEKVLDYWSQIDGKRQEKYGEALNLIKQSYNEKAEINKVMQYTNEALIGGAEIVLFPYKAFNFYNTLSMDPNNTGSVEAETENMKIIAKDFFKDYNPETDKKILSAMLLMYYEDVSSMYHPSIFQTVEEEYNGDFDKYAEELFNRSLFTDETRTMHFLNMPNIEGTIWNSSELLLFTYKFEDLYNLLKTAPTEKEKISEETSLLKETAHDFFAIYDLETDKAKMKAEFKKFYDNTTSEFLPDIFTEIKNTYNGNTDAFIDNMFKNSVFLNRKKLDKFLAEPTLNKIENDPALKTTLSIAPLRKTPMIEDDMAFNLMISILRAYFQLFNDDVTAADMKLQQGMRQYLAALKEMKPEMVSYPDANATMRLTYGKVCEYFPADAVKYKYYTTLDGVMEKENPNDSEFIVSEKLKSLHKNKDYGRYGENGTLKTCFISNNDITGGNSGSPVLNGNGELIGIAFDGNWEAMSGDIAFEPEIQRTINVDIRYVLFVIEKYAGAKNLIDEMRIIE